MIIEDGYPVTINSNKETTIAANTAEQIVGEKNVERKMIPIMGSEDFSFMLLEKPGAYILIGNGDGKGGCMIHHSSYDFNDRILPLGASYWIQLAENILT